MSSACIVERQGIGDELIKFLRATKHRSGFKIHGIRLSGKWPHGLALLV